MSDAPSPPPPRSSRIAADDAADALARMMSPDPPPGGVSPPTSSANPVTPSRTSSPATRSLPASPKPRPADAPDVGAAAVAATKSRPLPKVAGSEAVSIRPGRSRPGAGRAWREALVPPLLVMGVLLAATGVISLTVGERLVIGSLPVWMGLTAIGAGVLLVLTAVLNARTLARNDGV